MTGGEGPTATTDEVSIPCGDRALRGTLWLPAHATAVVVFAHGSGSSRMSPRNLKIAQALQEAGLGTLLVDLLEENEAGDRSKTFDIGLLAARLRCAADWLMARPGGSSYRLGYFGASTGAGAALWAAAHAPAEAPVGAIVSRGGRPDLARAVLPQLTTPTLLIVGSDDEIVLELNREAFDLLAGPRELEIIPGASHLFPEPGALEQVAALAREWFVRYLT